MFEAQRNNIAQEPRLADFNDDFNKDFSKSDGTEIGSPGYWKRYDPVSVWLSRLQETAITNMVQTFLTKKSLLKESKQILERRTFFDGAGRLSNTLPSGQSGTEPNSVGQT